MVRLEFDYDFRYVSKNGQSTKNALKTDRYIPTNDRGHLTYLQSSRAIVKFVWRFGGNRGRHNVLCEMNRGLYRGEKVCRGRMFLLRN